MDKDNIFSYRSQLNLNTTEYEPVKNLKTMASSVLHNRAKTFNHLQKFYMPIMKKAFEDSKSTHPSLPSPDEVLFSSRLFEMKQKEDKVVIESLRRQIEMKNNKILRLQNEFKTISKNLLLDNLIPSSDRKYDDPYTNLRKIESHLNIKNNEALFRSKTRVNSILQQFNLPFNTLQSINNKTNETQLIDFVVSKLEPIAQQYKSLLNGNFQKRNQLQNKHIQLEYENKQLKQSFEIIRNAQSALRQQLQHIKQNWSKSNGKIISLQKQIQQKDTQLYRLRKVLEDKKQSIQNIHKQASQKVELEANLRINHQTQANELILLYQASCVQNLELKKQIEHKQFQFSELKAAYEFLTEQFNKINRINITLKSRYEPQDKTQVYYSPRTYHDKQISFIKNIKHIQLQKNQKQQTKQYCSPRIIKRDSHDTDFSVQPSGKLRLQKIVQIKNQIQQKEHQLWRLSHPSRRQNKDDNQELEYLKIDIQRLTNQMNKLQNSFPLNY